MTAGDLVPRPHSKGFEHPDNSDAASRYDKARCARATISIVQAFLPQLVSDAVRSVK